MKPLVSVIVPTRNSEQSLGACLKSIVNQTYKNIEIVVVDQESTDDTQNIARKYKTKLIIVPRPPGYSPPTVSRNKGASASKGIILYHLDSDMELPAGLVQNAVDKLSISDKTVALVVNEEDRVDGFWSKSKALERKCYWGNDNIESARIVRREVFEKVGGYDEKINSGEDFDIHRRYKKLGDTDFCDIPVTHNLNGITFRRSIVKKYGYGKTAKAYLNKSGEKGSRLLAEQLMCMLKHYDLILKKPATYIGAFVLKISEFAAGGLGYLVARDK